MTSPCMWSHRLHNLPMSSLSNLGFLHKAHLLILFTPGLPQLGNLSLNSGLGLPPETQVDTITTEIETERPSAIKESPKSKPG